MSFVLWGDAASNLLDDAREKSGLNETQAQICLLLSGYQDGVQAEPKALTPAEMSRALCSPGARIHNQLAILVERNWLARVKANNPDLDARRRPYALTRSGLKQAAVYRDHMLKADRMFSKLFTKKELDALHRLDTRLAEAMSVGAFSGKADLEAACAKGAITLPHRWNQ